MNLRRERSAWAEEAFRLLHLSRFATAASPWRSALTPFKNAPLDVPGLGFVLWPAG